MSRSNVPPNSANRFNSAVGSAPVGVVPFTICCWFNIADFATTQTLVNLRLNTEVSNHRWQLLITTGLKLQAVTKDTGASSAETINSATSGSWVFATGIWAENNNRISILDGDWTNRGVNILLRTPVGVNQLQVGIRGLTNNSLRGRIARIAIYKSALTQAQVEFLATGASYRRVQLDNLVYDDSFRMGDANGDQNSDRAGGLTLVEDGTMGNDSINPPFAPLKSPLIL